MQRQHSRQGAAPAAAAGRRRQQTVADAVAAALLACLVLQLSATAVSAAAAGAEQVMNLRAAGRSRCGHDHDDAEYSAARQTIANVQRMGLLNYNTRVAMSSAVTVPVDFHVVTKADGTGNVTMDQITQQMTISNQFYAPNFVFMLGRVDYTINNLWYSGSGMNKTLEYALKTELHTGGNDTLNIYTVDPSPYLGFSYYPTILSDPSTAILDGLMIHPATLPGGAFSGYNLGGTIVHETGHWLLLSHTFQGGCSDPNDFVSDTPPQAGASSGCPVGRKSCDATMFPGADPIHSPMDYSDDACYLNFTPGQMTRMQWAWITYRAFAQQPGRSPDSQEQTTGGLNTLSAPPPPPVKKPTKKPTPRPTPNPTKKPTRKPTRRPTKKPTRHSNVKRLPTKKPTKKKPTRRPTSKMQARVAAILKKRAQSLKLARGSRRLLAQQTGSGAGAAGSIAVSDGSGSSALPGDGSSGMQ